MGNTSRDQYSGVFFGLGAAYDLVDNEAFRGSIRTLVTQLLEFLLKHLWTVVMPGGALSECPGRAISTTFIGRPEQQLNFLQIGRQSTPNVLKGSTRNFGRFSLPLLSRNCRWRHSTRMALTSSSIWRRSICITCLRLEERGPALCDITAMPMASCAMRCVTHGNAHFNMIDRALNGADPVRDQETIGLLDDWLKRPDDDGFVDLRQPPWNYPACPPPDDRGCNVVPVAERVRTDFLWQRSPFLLFGGGDGTIKGSGIDFILPYWMARYYGVL